MSDNDFLNAAACSETLLDPLEVLHLTQAIEKEMGRTAKSVERVYSDRPIDIDLLMYDDTVMQTPELTLPHPLMGNGVSSWTRWRKLPVRWYTLFRD